MTDHNAEASRQASDRMVVADLHVHTTRSDGTLAPGDVSNVARQANLAAVAITDHDRLPPLSTPVERRDGVTVIGGIELRVATQAGNIDLLGYGVDPTPDLEREIERLQTDRVERAREIVARVEDRLGVALDVDYGPGVGRPHIARSIADSPAPYDVDDAFADLIGDDGPCYVAREITPYERGRELLGAACALVSLAHPLRYDEPSAALARASALDAVELAYPYDGPVDLTPVKTVIDRADLLATGGSDAHGERLGAAGLDRDDFVAVRDRIERWTDGS